MDFENKSGCVPDETPAVPKKEPQVYGLSFEQALNSTAEIWRERLQNEGYPGDLSQAALCMMQTIKGMSFLYHELIKRGIISEGQEMPRVDFDNQPGFSIFFFKPANTIIASWDYLRQFDGHDLSEQFERKSKYGITVFRGTISEFLFLKGVEELTHALDKDISETLDPNISTLDYPGQNHEYKALKWQLNAARMNHFSNEAVASLSDLLRKISKHRRTETKQ